jgi:hypothetical protein
MVRLQSCQASDNDPIRFRNDLLFNPNDRQIRIDLLSPWQYRVTLQIMRIGKEEHAVNYRLQVSNRFGQSSANASLNITCNSCRDDLRNIDEFLWLLDEPSFLKAPANLTVGQGSNVYLEATIDGNPTPDVFIVWEDQHHKLLAASTNNSFLYRYLVQNIQSYQSRSFTFYAVSRNFSMNISAIGFVTVLGRRVDCVCEWPSSRYSRTFEGVRPFAKRQYRRRRRSSSDSELLQSDCSNSMFRQ